MTEIIKGPDFGRIMDEAVSPELEKIMYEGEFIGKAGARLKYRSYVPENAVRSVVILHGYTEGMFKYEELIGYLTGSGSAVYIYDQRGHGRSFRAVDDLTLTHVDRFEDYADDLSLFLNNVVPDTLPVFLFGHSMGGAVCSLWLERNQGRVSGAVLCSPMISPSTGNYPAFVGKLICRTMILFGKEKKRIFLSGPYPGEEKFEDACSSCRARFARYEYFKRTHPDYQNYSPTYRWTLESLLVPKTLLKKGEPEKIDVPVLVMIAGQDTVVRTDAIREFAARIPDCRVVDFPESKHEICYAEDPDVEKLVENTLGFFESHTPEIQ